MFAFFLVKIHFSVDIAVNIVLGFIATSFVASANYIINEWLDAEFDKFHPTKKYRPVVSGNLKTHYIIIEYIIFSFAGFILAWKVSVPVFILEAVLWIMGIIYNVRPFRSKEIPYIDVLSESVNNAIRFMIGWTLIAPQYLAPASIVFGYWMGGAFLMAIKRFAEYRMIGDKTQAALYRKSFKYYNEKTLLVSAFFYAMLSLFFCGVFLIRYKIELVLGIPFLAGLFCMYLYIAYKSDSSVQRPEKLMSEKRLMLYIVMLIAFFCVLMNIELQFLHEFFIYDPQSTSTIHFIGNL